MNACRRLLITLLVGVLATLGLATLPVVAGAATPNAIPGTDFARVCPASPAPGQYTCYSLRRTDIKPQIANTGPTDGYGPADLRSAYALPSTTAGVGQTVYVIDAYGYPNAESDLAVYRAQYGIPACTTGNGCFKKLNQSGQTSPLPTPNAGWEGETALDLDMVSAVCPNCHITLIQADDNGNNLFTAVARANTLGAKFVSMSWGGSESGNEAALDSAYFNRTGVVYSASSGDGAYQAGVSYPATSKNVVSVGGTALVPDGSARGWAESVWETFEEEGTGSGCSSDEAKPTWQNIISSSVCSHRAENDVAAVADPDTGVAVYELGSQYGDWSVAGGTSASAPIIASIYALAGPPAAADHPASYLYSHRSSLHDVTVGANGSCSPTLLCTAASGWDSPTGLGTPNGVTAFKGGQTVTVTNPGAQAGSTDNPASLAMTATDSPAGPTLTYAATGLPTGLTINASTGVISGTPTVLGTSSVVVTATDGTGAKGTASFSWRIGNAGTLTPVTAFRMLDTRNGTGAPSGIVPAGGSVALQVLGRGGVPASGVSAVILNVTVTAPGNLGYVTVYPDGTTRPTTSNLDYKKAETIPNLVVAPVGADGKVRLYTSAAAHLIADVSGYYLKGAPVQNGAFSSLNPVRLLDTRNGNGAPVGAVQNGATVALQVQGRGGVPANHVSAVVLNVTATGSTGNGYVTAFPSGTTRPLASNLDFPPGKTVPNLVVVPVGADGKVSLYLWGGGNTTNLIADVFGYYTDGTPTAGGTLGALPPSRLLDTRNGTGVGTPITVAGGQTVTLQVTGNGGVPAMTSSPHPSAVLLNVLVTAPTGAGYVTVYSADGTKPNTSNLDYSAGQTVANLVVVPVSSLGRVKLTVTGQGTTALVSDVTGYYLSGP